MKAKLLALLSAAVLAVSASGFAQPVSAGTLTLELDTVFNGATPAGSTPWLTAVFDDTAAGEVTLTGTANLIEPNNAKEWYFNYTGDLSLLNASVTSCTGCVVTSIDFNSSGSFAPDAFMADGAGGGSFDWLISLFPGDTFSGTDEFIIVLTSIEGGFNFSFFDAFNTNGLWQSAAHIRAIGEDSGWIATPIPAAAWLFGSALLGLIGVGRTRGRRARRAA